MARLPVQENGGGVVGAERCNDERRRSVSELDGETPTRHGEGSKEVGEDRVLTGERQGRSKSSGTHWLPRIDGEKLR
jgi:hypothetical protein